MEDIGNHTLSSSVSGSERATHHHFGLPKMTGLWLALTTDVSTNRRFDSDSDIRRDCKLLTFTHADIFNQLRSLGLNTSFSLGYKYSHVHFRANQQMFKKTHK